MLALTLMLALGAADVSIEVVVSRPLKLTRVGELTGEISVRIENRGDEPVTLQHRDVHGFTFTAAKGGAPALLFHSCDCGFELGLQPQPAARTFTLAPRQQRVLRFDDFACGGGPYRPPPPGEYRLSFQLAVAPSTGGAPAVGVAPKQPAELDFKECERRLAARPPPALASPPVAVKLTQQR